MRVYNTLPQSGTWQFKYKMSYTIHITDWDASTQVATLDLSALAPLSSRGMVCIVSCENGENAQDAMSRARVRERLRAANVMIIDPTDWDASGGTLQFYAENVPTDIINVDLTIFSEAGSTAYPIVINALP